MNLTAFNRALRAVLSRVGNSRLDTPQIHTKDHKKETLLSSKGSRLNPKP